MNDHERPPRGGEISPEDKFFLDWGLETIKSNITRLNELQKNIVTLSVSLLGGSLVFYTDAYTTPLFKWCAISFLILAAIVSVIGSIPEEYKMDLDSPRDIEQKKAKTLTTKKCWYMASAALLLAGVCLAAAGLIARHLAS